MINALIPNIDQYDILSLRQYAFIAKGISLLVLFTCSCIYLYKRYNERRLYAYLTMLSSYLLIATILLPSIVFNMNDLMLILTSFAFSLSAPLPLYFALECFILKKEITFIENI